MICYHHDDLDGQCAAAIVLKKYPDCKMREINYSEEPDFAKEVEKDERVYIVDFSFKPEKMSELYDVVGFERVCWIDHHKTALSYEEMYLNHSSAFGYHVPGNRDFTSPGKSGCELTWKFLFPEEPTPEAVTLLGIYDTWRFTDENRGRVMAFQFGLRSEETSPNNVIWNKLLSNVGQTQITTTGGGIIRYKNNVSKNILKNHYKIIWEGWSCVVVNGSGGGDMFKNYPNNLCISWIFTGEKYIVSLRSRNPDNCDVSEIAKKYGGGGHSGAAGFVCESLPWKTNNNA